MDCFKCHKPLVANEVGDGVCYWCKRDLKPEELAELSPIRVARERERVQKKIDEALNSSVIMTTETVILDRKVKVRFGVVTSECVYGMNIFRDMAAAVVDIIGGKSTATQDVLRDAREKALLDLRDAASDYGANAVVGIDIDIQELGGGGKSMLMVAASGTAVLLE